MKAFVRHSPLVLEGNALQTEKQNDWQVALQYEEEQKAGLALVDLSHRSKWDIQDRQLAVIRPGGVPIPENPGECIFGSGFLINRMNRTQAACWHIIGDPPLSPDSPAFTETTDAMALVALMGPRLFFLMEKLCALDLHASLEKTPCLFQAPVMHIASQVVFLGQWEDHQTILVACARGYGQSMLDGLRHGGQEFGLHPTGERAFYRMVQRIFQSAHPVHPRV